MPAGILVHSFDLKEISYAPVIASAMLRRQQVRLPAAQGGLQLTSPCGTACSRAILVSR